MRYEEYRRPVQEPVPFLGTCEIKKIPCTNGMPRKAWEYLVWQFLFIPSERRARWVLVCHTSTYDVAFRIAEERESSALSRAFVKEISTQ